MKFSEAHLKYLSITRLGKVQEQILQYNEKYCKLADRHFLLAVAKYRLISPMNVEGNQMSKLAKTWSFLRQM